MGWCSGSQLANEVWDEVKAFIPDEKQKDVAKEIVDIFSNHDADCWEDPKGVEGIGYPEWFKGDDE